MSRPNNRAPLLRKTMRWPCCSYCRDFSPKQGDRERRQAKRSERNRMKKEIS